MAVREVTAPDAGRRFRRFVWEGLKNDDTGKPVSVPGVSSMYFQVTGMTGVIAIEGSLEEFADTDNFFVIENASAMPMYLSDGQGAAVPYPGVMHIRPRVDDGDEDTEFTVILYIRSN